MKDYKHNNVIIESFKKWSDNDREIINDGLILMGLHREIEMYTEILGSRFKLPLKQMEILEILVAYPERQLTPAELADEIHLTRSTMTGNLDTLQEKGLISRESHPKDRRMTLIKITKKGIEFCNEKIPQLYTDLLKVMSLFTSEDRNHLKKIYIKLLTLFKELATEVVN